MRSFDELVAEAAAADVTGWGFDWLNGRATEERPPWGYAKLLADRLGQVESALDIDTGGGEVLAEAPTFPPRMVATEAWPPNAQHARELLGPRGVQVIQTVQDAPLPLPDESFELVTDRHPVRPDWEETRRALAPGGCYFAQHVGPASAFELIEHFLGPLLEERNGATRSRNPPPHRTPAWSSPGCAPPGVAWSSTTWAPWWILRKCVWWVPDFSVEKYRDRLVQLDTQMCGAANLSSRTRPDT